MTSTRKNCLPFIAEIFWFLSIFWKMKTYCIKYVASNTFWNLACIDKQKEIINLTLNTCGLTHTIINSRKYYLALYSQSSNNPAQTFAKKTTHYSDEWTLDYQHYWSGCKFLFNLAHSQPTPRFISQWSGPTLSVVGHRSGIQSTETCRHVMTGKGTPLKTSIYWANCGFQNLCITWSVKRSASCALMQSMGS